MKLNQLAGKPKLIEVEIADEDIIKQFGETLTFHTYDRQPLDVFMSLVSMDQQDQGKMFQVIRKLILDEKGNEIISEESMLPGTVLLKCVTKIVELLGK